MSYSVRMLSQPGHSSAKALHNHLHSPPPHGWLANQDRMTGITEGIMFFRLDIRVLIGCVAT